MCHLRNWKLPHLHFEIFRLYLKFAPNWGGFVYCSTPASFALATELINETPSFRFVPFIQQPVKRVPDPPQENLEA